MDAIKIFSLSDKDGILLTGKLIFIQIYLPNIRKKCYTLGVEALSECEKYILALIEPDIAFTKKLEDDLIMSKYIEEAEELSNDHSLREIYDKE